MDGIYCGPLLGPQSVDGIHFVDPTKCGWKYSEEMNEKYIGFGDLENININPQKSHRIVCMEHPPLCLSRSNSVRVYLPNCCEFYLQ